MEGYLNAKLFVEILKKTPQELTRASFFKAAETGKKINVGMGSSLSFSKTDHQASDAVFFTTVSNGAWKNLVDWKEIKK